MTEFRAFTFLVGLGLGLAGAWLLLLTSRRRERGGALILGVVCGVVLLGLGGQCIVTAIRCEDIFCGDW